MLAGVITVNKRPKLAIQVQVVIATIIGFPISIESVAQPHPPTSTLSSRGALEWVPEFQSPLIQPLGVDVLKPLRQLEANVTLSFF